MSKFSCVLLSSPPVVGGEAPPVVGGEAPPVVGSEAPPVVGGEAPSVVGGEVDPNTGLQFLLFILSSLNHLAEDTCGQTDFFVTYTGHT